MWRKRPGNNRTWGCSGRKRSRWMRTFQEKTSPGCLPRQCIKKQRHYFANKGPSSQSYDFPSSHVWMWELNLKESWARKNWCFWTVVLEKTFGSPLDCKEIQPVHPKGDQSWVFIGRTDAEAETPVLWPPYAKSWLIGKDPDSGRDWGQEEKGTTEDEMAGWHHRLDAHEFEQTSGDGEGQGGLECCNSWGHKESDTDTTEQLRNSNNSPAIVESEDPPRKPGTLTPSPGSCFFFFFNLNCTKTIFPLNQLYPGRLVSPG